MTGNIARAGSLTIELPDWLAQIVAEYPEPLATDEARMALTIRLSQENVRRGGGPFGGTVFFGDRLLASGVNLVLASGYSIAHAEIVALMAAQSALGGGALNLPPLTLFASTEPCCQCFGALVWAGAWCAAPRQPTRKPWGSTKVRNRMPGQKCSSSGASPSRERCCAPKRTKY
jgi:hypothetical protein